MRRPCWERKIWALGRPGTDNFSIFHIGRRMAQEQGSQVRLHRLSKEKAVKVMKQRGHRVGSNLGHPSEYIVSSLRCRTNWDQNSDPGCLRNLPEEKSVLKQSFPYLAVVNICSKFSPEVAVMKSICFQPGQTLMCHFRAFEPKSQRS